LWEILFENTDFKEEEDRGITLRWILKVAGCEDGRWWLELTQDLVH
jgi:hypothetical protein